MIIFGLFYTKIYKRFNFIYQIDLSNLGKKYFINDISSQWHKAVVYKWTIAQIPPVYHWLHIPLVFLLSLVFNRNATVSGIRQWHTSEQSPQFHWNITDCIITTGIPLAYHWYSKYQWFSMVFQWYSTAIFSGVIVRSFKLDEQI